MDGVVFYSNSYLDENTAEITTNIKIVDDLNVEGSNLSQRRLRLSAQKAPLYPLRVAVYYLGDFIKLAKKGTWFIDSNGKLFTYTKTTSAKLTFHKIKKIIPSPTTGSIVEVVGFPDRFRTLFVATPSARYAGILEYKGISILYGLYDQEYKTTRRMI